MPRSIWNGALAFGLVNVPVKVYSATESKTVHFREVHAKDAARIEHRRICPADGKQIDYDDIVKGHEVKAGEWVELTDDEIAAAAGSGARLVDLDHFVPADAIDPAYYERTYHVGVGKGGDNAYSVLHAALKRTGRAGVGRWIFHNRERTVIVRALGPALAMHTMRFAAEIADPEALELARVRRAPGKRELEMASSLVKGLHAKFRPADYEDEYRKAVLDVVARKAAGKNIEPPAEEDSQTSRSSWTRSCTATRPTTAS
jgi:DNA end-binding protein Ku